MKSSRAARSRVVVLAAAGLVSFGAAPGVASNGMNMIGYGAESIAMGGADLAVTGSASSMNINPAGIGRCVQPEVGFALGVLDPDVTHSDRLGNDSSESLDRKPMPFLGYVHPRGELTFGIGLFVQGGMGAEHRSLTTPFSALAGSGQLPAGAMGASTVPPRDTTLTELAHARLTPTVAWRVGPRLTLGAALNVSYAQLEMRLFPQTSVLIDLDGSGVPGDSPREGFFGMHGRDLSAWGLGLRLGFQFDNGALALGGTYSTETDLDFDGGSMDLNLSALGPGKVAYDCELTDFAWPRHAALGAAYQLSPSILIAADVDWFDWSSAISTVRIDLENPQQPGAPPNRQIPMRMQWRDQWVFAVGLELSYWRDWTLRMGYNHGDSPIPDDMVRPLFPAIAEDHITAGAGYRRGPWIFDLALEYVLETEATNNNPDPSVNLFGPGSTESLSQLVVHLMMRRSVFSGKSGRAGG